jgi:predicted nucleic-acid-binding protein
MRAIDTNVLVRLLSRDDPQQRQAAERFVAEGAWVSLLVLLETVWVLRARYDRDARQLAAVVAVLLEHRNLVFEDAAVIQSALEAFRRRPRVGFADHLILAVAKRSGHKPLGTFDRALAREDGAELIPAR